MFPSKLNSLLTGTLVAIIIAVGGSVVAQDALRLWKPYSPESFGGGRRSNDGVYCSVSGIYWSISAPGGGYVGATTTKGKDETRLVFDLNTATLREQTNSFRINMMTTDTSLGTRFEVGNRRGHHGWLVSAYGLYGQSRSVDIQNHKMAIRDEGKFAAPAGQVIFGEVQEVGFLWGPNFGTVMVMDYVSQGPAGNNVVGWVPESGGWVFYRGHDIGGYVLDEWERWGYVPAGVEYYFPGLVEEPDQGIIAPLEVAFDDVNITVRSRHQSAELMYTYRMHPFTWGAMELLAGARYWDLEDEFGYSGVNSMNVGADGVTTTYGPIRAFEDMVVDAKGYNRVFGPQVGIKLNRQNARWSFNAEGRLVGGINMQTARTSGHVTPHRDYTPIGLQDAVDLGDNRRTNNVYFGHRQNKTYFSPIGELRFSADWQWTDAVSFFGAVDGMCAGNIARGVRITDYTVKPGTIFGIRGNDRNASVAVYGVETGIKIRR